MSQSPADLRSLCQSFLRSGCQNRWRAQTAASKFFCVIGVAPLWGFGTFSAITPVYSGPNSFFGGMTFNDVWPSVYSTMTESWSDGNGGTGTTTSVYAQYADIPFTVTSSVGFNAQTGGTYSFTITGTSITASYTWTDMGGGHHTGTYSATLSGLISPSWAALTAQANALVAEVTLPAAPGGIPDTFWATPPDNYVVLPISVAPGYVILSSATAMSFGDAWAVAAMQGMPIRDQFQIGGSYPPNSTVGGIFAFVTNSTTIATAPTYNSGGVVPNIGGCASAASVWWLAGAATGVARPFPGTYPNPLELYMQEYTTSGGMGTINSAPNPFSLVATGGYNYPNPFGAAVPLLLTFGPADVQANLQASGGSHPYGILDFNSTAY